MSNHLKRLLVALVAIPVIIYVTIKGGFVFFLFATLISSFALLEFYGLAKAKGARPLRALGLITGCFVLLAFFNNNLFELFGNWFGSAPKSESQFLLIVFLTAIPVIGLVELFRNNGSALNNLSTTIFGVAYVSLFFGTLVGVREVFTPLHVPVVRLMPSEFMSTELNERLYLWGGYTVVSIYTMIWVCDSAAYYVGKSIGKHKLFPRVSPNKSWEGAIAGFLFAVATSIAAKYLVLDYLQLQQAIVLGVIVGLFGQLGDLFESLLKRDAGVKDSSNIIPGHGGILDRFDSLLFVSPIVYLYLDFVVFSFN